MVSADHIILLPETAERTGCQAVGNICDISLTFVVAGPTTTTSSDDFYHMFTIKWIAYMEVPERIGSDMGSAFVANAAKLFEQLFGVTIHMFSEAPDHHEHTSYIKNLNKLLRDMIDRADHHGDVCSREDVELMCALYMVCANQILVRFMTTPFEIMYGQLQPPRTPILCAEHTPSVVPPEVDPSSMHFLRTLMAHAD